MSRVQETKAQIRVGNLDSNACPVKPSSTAAVGDTIFMQRVKSRVRHWRGSWKNANEETTGEKFRHTYLRVVLFFVICIYKLQYWNLQMLLSVH